MLRTIIKITLFALALPLTENFVIVPNGVAQHMPRLRAGAILGKFRQAHTIVSAGSLSNEDEWYDSEKVPPKRLFYFIQSNSSNNIKYDFSGSRSQSPRHVLQTQGPTTVNAGRRAQAYPNPKVQWEMKRILTKTWSG